MRRNTYVPPDDKPRYRFYEARRVESEPGSGRKHWYVFEDSFCINGPYISAGKAESYLMKISPDHPYSMRW